VRCEPVVDRNIPESMIKLKTEQEIERMRQAGKIVAAVLDKMHTLVRPGVTTGYLDTEAEALIRALGGTPSFKGYLGYPASICTSVNEEIVHGIPGTRILVEGDIVSVDVGAIWNGYQGDAAITLPVGAITDQARRLLEVTKDSLAAGIGTVRAGSRMGNLSNAVETTARQAGFEVVREYGGHGIGQEMHEAPRIPNWGKKGQGLVLKAGMTFAIEPMLTAGDYRTRQLGDHWTVVTMDSSLAAHFEHTIVVTEDGADILTRL
jgi:methionyl aminopeptidase